MDGTLLKKVAGIVEHGRAASQIDDGAQGLWIAGEQHVVYWLDAPPRLAGNVLLWEDGGVTYRLEGKAPDEGARARAGTRDGRLSAGRSPRRLGRRRNGVALSSQGCHRHVTISRVRLDRIGAGGG